VHPLTPLVRSWQFIAVVGFFLVQDAGQRWIGSPGFGGPSVPPTSLPSRDTGLRVWLAGGGVLLLALAALVGLAVLSWRMTRYRVTSDALELHRGVLFRQHRLAQLDRLQAVDVVQPLLARIFGLARLSLEVAGSGSSKIELAYVTDAQARELRNHLLAGAAGLHYETDQAPEAPEQHWLEVPVGRLVASILLSSSTATLLVTTLGFIVASIALGTMAPAAGVLPALIGIGGVLWARFSHGFGFRVATSPDGLRLRHGLLEQRTQTVPPGRVQAVRLSQPLLWRRAGWWRVQVNVAGYGTGGDESKGESETVLLPVGTRDEAVAVLAFVAPDLGVGPDEHPRLVVDAGLDGTGAAQGFVTSPRQARWFDWISWQRNGFRVTDQALLVRHGVIERSLVLVPHARTQSLGVTQGPVQRRLGLASFALHSTPGPISPTVAHLSEPVAAHLLATQAERARLARAGAGPEQWMRPEASR
jgi:putative membrane protein